MSLSYFQRLTIALPITLPFVTLFTPLPFYLSLCQPSFFLLSTNFTSLPSFFIYLPCLPFTSFVHLLIRLTHFSSHLPLYRVPPSRSACLFLPPSLPALSSFRLTCLFWPSHTRCSFAIDFLLVTHTPRGALQISTNELSHLKFWGMSNV